MGSIQRFNRGYLPLIFLFILSINGEEEEEDPCPTVYELLPEYGLPIGLLPDSETSYTLSEDGSFEVYLQKQCYVQFEYLVYYGKIITGKLNMGRITHLEGIQVKRLLFWFDVNAIKVDLPPSDSIYFTVGIIDKRLDVHQFQTVHPCRDNDLGLCGGGFLRYDSCYSLLS